MEKNELFKKIKGCLIGCAYGDAMGMPTEMMTPERIRSIFPDGVHKLEPSTEYDFIGRKFPAGEVTDDTVNTVLVCESIIGNNGVFDTEKYINMLLEWVKNNGDKNPYIMGPNTLKAITAIQNGADMRTTGRYSTSNGSAMKISPIGIVYDYRDKKNFIDAVEKLCLPTHNTSIAISGAAAVAACVSYAIRGGFNLDELWELAKEFIIAAKERGNQLPSASLLARMDALESILKAYKEEEVVNQLQLFFGTGVETIETIPAVMTIVMLAKGDPYKAAEISANIGGDTDTIGAISTAICGALNPIFEESVISVLEAVNDIGFEELSTRLMMYSN
jgi:ADP-ribosylglycohydrolase